MESLYEYLGRSSVVLLIKHLQIDIKKLILSVWLLFVSAPVLALCSFQSSIHRNCDYYAKNVDDALSICKAEIDKLAEAGYRPSGCAVANNRRLVWSGWYTRNIFGNKKYPFQFVNVWVNDTCEGALDTQTGVCEPLPNVSNYPKNTCNVIGNPCQVSTGAKFLNEHDFRGDMPFTRNYHSLNLSDNGFGKGWHNPYFKGLSISGDNLSIFEGSGRGEPWRKVDGVWTGDTDSDYLVAETATGGFTVIDSRENVSEYDSEGRLLSETTSQGLTQNYIYDAENRLISVANHYGVSLSFNYSTDGKNHITQVVDADGNMYRYEYDSNDNLVAVIYPDTTADDSDNPRRIYHYENTDFPNHLTGITDAEGDRHATYEYDSEGRAIVSEHAKTTNSVGQKQIQLSY